MNGAVFQPGDVIAEKFRVIRALGIGGMGAVYEVEHLFTHHRRALKLLHPDMAVRASIVQRFLREASAAGRIGSPHIVETFDAGRLPQGEPYLVMELLDGRSLAQAIEERGTLTFGEALEIVAQAADGVHAAHEAGIVHRDLKPDNLFLQRGTGRVKVLDFGISKFDPELTRAEALTVEGAAMGTPFYMPPEQVRGDKSLDARADIYALGVVLYECLTGRKPFEAETVPHLAILIYQGQYRPVTAVRPNLPPVIDGIIARAMHLDREQRYPTAKSFGEALRTLQVETGSAVGLDETQVLGTPDVRDPRIAFQATQDLSQAPLASGVGAGTAGPAIVADTRDPISVTSSPEGRGAGKTPAHRWAIPVGLVLLAAAGYAAFQQRSGAAPEHAASAEPSAPAAAAAGTPSTPAVARPSVEIAPAQPELAGSGAEPAAASAVPPPSARPAGTGVKAPRPGNTAAPSATPRSRARELGLSEENPFAK